MSFYRRHYNRKDAREENDRLIMSMYSFGHLSCNFSLFKKKKKIGLADEKAFIFFCEVSFFCFFFNPQRTLPFSNQKFIFMNLHVSSHTPPVLTQKS